MAGAPLVPHSSPSPFFLPSQMPPVQTPSNSHADVGVHFAPSWIAGCKHDPFLQTLPVHAVSPPQYPPSLIGACQHNPLLQTPLAAHAVPPPQAAPSLPASCAQRLRTQLSSVHGSLSSQLPQSLPHTWLLQTSERGQSASVRQPTLHARAFVSQ